MFMKNIKNIHLAIFGLFLLLSLFLISKPLIFKETGVMIFSVPEDGPCNDILLENSIITSVNGVGVENSVNFYKALESGHKNYNFMINGNPRSCEVPENSSLVIEVANIEKDGIKFGIDMVGGSELTLIPKSDLTSSEIEVNIDQINQRAEIIGVSGFSLENNGNIKISYIESDDYNVKQIIRPGVMEFKLPQKIRIKNGTGKIKFSDDAYEFEYKGDHIIFRNETFRENDYFMIEAVKFEVDSLLNNETTLLMNVFEGDDLSVMEDSEFSRVSKINNNAYQFLFQVELSPTGSEVFEKVTKNQELVITNFGESILKEQMIIFIDGKEFVWFPIFDIDAGKKISVLNIFGVEITKDEAERKMNYLNALMSSKDIDEFSVESRSVEGDLTLLKIYSIGTLALLVIAPAVIFLKTKDMKSSLLVFGLPIATIVLLFGIISSKVLIMLGMVLSIFFVVLSKELDKKIGYLGMFLLFVISFGFFVNSPVVDYNLLGAFLAFSLIAAFEFIVMFNVLKFVKKDLLVKINWYFIVFLSIVLVAMFFLVKDLKGFSMTLSAGVLLLLGFTKPIAKYFKDND